MDFGLTVPVDSEYRPPYQARIWIRLIVIILVNIEGWSDISEEVPIPAGNVIMKQVTDLSDYIY
jgi:hypothetical protein